MPDNFVLLLLRAAIRAVPLGLVTFLGLLLFRVRSSAARHATWTVVLVGMLLEIPLAVLPPTVAIKVLPSHATPMREAEAKLRPALPASRLPQALAPASYTGMEGKRERVSLTALVCGAYLVVSILLFVRMAVGLWRLRAIFEDAKPIPGAPPGIFESALLAAPGSVGCFRPRILLPLAWKDWEEVKLRAVLAHERAHIRRRDWPIRVAARVNTCIFWFHPLAWWMDRELARLAEEAADDLAVSEMKDREEYAAALLDIAIEAESHRRMLGWGVSSMASESNAIQRVNRILGGRFEVPKPLGRLAWAMLLACGLPAIYLSSTVKFASANRDLSLFKQAVIRSTEPSVVVAIVVHGNRSVPTDVIWAHLSVHVGERYDQASMERTMKSLWDTGHFESILNKRERVPKGWAIHIYVRERSSTQQNVAQGSEQKSSTRRIAQVALDPRPTPALPTDRQKDAPLTMCILVDNSGSMRDHRAVLQTATLALVKHSKPEDEVCIVHFNDEAFSGLPNGEDFTSELNEMEEALRPIDSRGGSAMRDAVLKSINKLQQTGHHRQRFLVLVTDGNDTSSSVTQDELLEKVKCSGVRVYSIGLLSQNSGDAAAGRLALGRLAAVSGGREYYPKDVSEVESISPDIRDDARRQ